MRRIVNIILLAVMCLAVLPVTHVGAVEPTPQEAQSHLREPHAQREPEPRAYLRQHRSRFYRNTLRQEHRYYGPQHRYYRDFLPRPEPR